MEYEDFVANPRNRLKDILDSFGYKYTDQEIANSVSGVLTKNVGKGRMELEEEIIHNIMYHIKETLIRYNYV